MPTKIKLKLLNLLLSNSLEHQSPKHNNSHKTQIHQSSAAENTLSQQAMFWKMYRHTFLSRSWATRHLQSHDIRFLNPAAQGMFFHLTYYDSDDNQSGSSILKLKSAFLKATVFEGTSSSLSVAAFGRTWRKQQPGKTHLSLTQPDQRQKQHLWKNLITTKPSFQCSSTSSGGHLRALTTIHNSKQLDAPL